MSRKYYSLKIDENLLHVKVKFFIAQPEKKCLQLEFSSYIKKESH